MKLIIDIPDKEYKYTCEMRLHNRTCYDDAIRNGTPFDSVVEDIKAEIENATTLHIGMVGYVEVEKVIDILDNIGKAEKRR